MLGETTVTVCLTWYDIKYPESRLQGEIIYVNYSVLAWIFQIWNLRDFVDHGAGRSLF